MKFSSLLMPYFILDDNKIALVNHFLLKNLVNPNILMDSEIILSIAFYS